MRKKKNAVSIMIIIFLVFVSIKVFASNQKIVEEENNYFKVTFVGVKDCPDCTYNIYLFDVLDKSNGKVKKLEYTIRARRIYILKLYRDKLIALGELSHGGDNVTVISLKNYQVIDTIWAYRLKFSPDNRYAIYVEHYPRFMPENSYPKRVINIYDFSSSPEDNRLDAKYVYSERYVGIPVFPEKNVKNKEYDFFLYDKKEKNSITSIFFWFNNNKKILFAEWYKNNNYLIIVDISNGIKNPNILRKKIDASLSDDLIENIKEIILITEIIEKDEYFEITTYKNFSNLKNKKIKIKKEILQSKTSK